ncbi:MAG: Hsp20/alpha crystallin family protein [Actinobacteria bacterium]|nr:Hsp20/alpha crystallin family protein [Actinomycetota bacterium]
MATDIAVQKKDRRLSRWFDWFEPPEVSSLFDSFRSLEDRIRVEEEMVGDDLVIRAELPGVDPDQDIEVTLDDDVLTVAAERRKEESSTKAGQFRSEFRYGSFRRSIRLPHETDAKAITASYRDGILEVKVPVPKVERAPQKVVIEKR